MQKLRPRFSQALSHHYGRQHIPQRKSLAQQRLLVDPRVQIPESFREIKRFAIEPQRSECAGMTGRDVAGLNGQVPFDVCLFEDEFPFHAPGFVAQHR